MRRRLILAGQGLISNPEGNLGAPSIMSALRNHYKGSKAFKRAWKAGKLSSCGAAAAGTLCSAEDQSDVDAHAEVVLATSPSAYNAADVRYAANGTVPSVSCS